MASITTWQRLEARSADDITVGLQGRVHDPLWLLARQWQLGEFQGEDAGSPVLTQIEGKTFDIDRYLPGPLPANGSGVGQRVGVSRAPLETLVEKEQLWARGFAPDFRFAVDAGREFGRTLETYGVGEFRSEYLSLYALRENPASYDEPARDFLVLMAGRVIDGVRLYVDLNNALRPVSGSAHLPAAPAIPQSRQEAVIKAAEAWLIWYDSRISEPPEGQSAWVTNRMEYAFSVSAAAPEGEIVLTTPEYVEGRLEWDAFSHRAGATLRTSPVTSSGTTIFPRVLIPAPVEYPGMPASRWWEFEDARVHFGAVRPMQQDLASIMFLQFATIFGNDWLVIPVQVPVGSICRLTSLTVTDSFGNVTSVKPFAQTGGASVGWKMFTLASSGSSGLDMLFLPPSLGTSLEGKPIEEVLLMRDEMANLAWAIESIVESRTGDRIDRRALFNSEHPPPQVAAAPAGADWLVYSLATAVPDYWVPLVPVRENDESMALKRGVVPGHAPTQVRGRILTSEQPLTLPDEEVPRSGVIVTRSWQYARWVDGSTHVWVGRRKEPGRGEGSSGLRFDSLHRE
jgi:hypothetical protein